MEEVGNVMGVMDGLVTKPRSGNPLMEIYY